ncbi:tetratricopeptide repeat protein [Ekhidna sp.]|uniref:tetratricopeptide repeat-containing sensor histidine kinase n=1 Tax=Ekhidna sp. TaxID=2608089 RepID=UPI003513B312
MVAKTTKNHLYLALKSLLILTLLTCHISAAQNQNKIDSLKKLIHSKNDTIAIDALNRLGTQYAPINFDSSLHYASLALNRAKRGNISDRIAESFNQKALAYDFKGATDTALIWYQKAFDQYASISDSSGMADIFLNMGVCYHYGSQNDSALAYYMKAASLKEQIGSIKNLGYIYNNVGMIFRLQSNYKRSIEYYKKSLKTKREAGDVPGIITTLGNLGIAYQGLKAYDSAGYFMEEGLELAKKLDDQTYAYRIYGNLGTNYYYLGDYQNALDYQTKALDWLYDNGEERDILFNEIALAKTLVKMKAYEAAKDHLGTGLDIAKRLEMLEAMSNIYMVLSETYEQQGDSDKALFNYKLYDSISNVLFDQTKASVIEELEQKYQAELREEEINRLELEKKASYNQRNILLLIAILILMIALFLFVLFRGKRKANQLIKKSLEEKEMLLKEIHHRVKNNLQIISSLLSLQSRFITDSEAKAAVAEGQHRVKSMALIHQKLYQHENLLGIDIQDYITNLTQSLISSYTASDRISLSLNITPVKLDVDTVIPLGLILNEVITNCIKHAFPSGDGTISIVVGLSNTLDVTVKDDGVGLKEGALQNESFGMRMIDSLSKKLDATTSFTNDDGTTFKMSISNYKET